MREGGVIVMVSVRGVTSGTSIEQAENLNKVARVLIVNVFDGRISSPDGIVDCRDAVLRIAVEKDGTGGVGGSWGRVPNTAIVDGDRVARALPDVRELGLAGVRADRPRNAGTVQIGHPWRTLPLGQGEVVTKSGCKRESSTLTPRQGERNAASAAGSEAEQIRRAVVGIVAASDQSVGRLAVFVDHHVQIIKRVGPVVTEVGVHLVHGIVGADDGEGYAIDRNHQILFAETESPDLELVIQGEAD